jgi:hypothetical protein
MSTAVTVLKPTGRGGPDDAVKMPGARINDSELQPRSKAAIRRRLERVVVRRTGRLANVDVAPPCDRSQKIRRQRPAGCRIVSLPP